MGHKVLEAYYKAKAAGYTHRAAIDAGMGVIADYMIYSHEDEEQGEVIPIVTQRFLEYAEYYKDEPWRVLDVEGVYNIPLGGGITYALTLDLLVEVTDGPYKGEQVVVDHKWTYNFWTKDEIFFAAQIPKYLWTLAKLGSTAKVGFLNQIRYRRLKNETPDQIFRRDLIEPDPARLENIMDIQKRMAMKIANIKLLGPENFKSEAIPSIHKQNCSTCFFKLPCSIELDGRDPARVLLTQFAKNTYNYDEISLRRNLE